MKREITYFEKPGKQNTDEVLELVRRRASEAGISRIVLASTTGYTARKAAEAFAGQEVELVVIPHQFGFDKPENKFPPELAGELAEAGHRVYWGTMLFHTVELYGSGVPTALANILRCFCQGIKVCFEIAFMAADAGCVSAGERIIVVAGTGSGADTAILASAATTLAVQDFHVHEILCMPG